MFLPCIAIPLLLLLSACAATSNGPSGLLGKPAPEFFLSDMSGRQASLSQFKGEVVVLDFWATWCPDCRQSLPHLQQIADSPQAAIKSLAVLAIDQSEDSGTIQSFLNQNHYTFTVVRDVDESAAIAYGLSSIPATVIIGRDGTIRNVINWSGPQSAQEIDQAVQTALADTKG